MLQKYKNKTILYYNKYYKKIFFSSHNKTKTFHVQILIIFL